MIEGSIKKGPGVLQKIVSSGGGFPLDIKKGVGGPNPLVGLKIKTFKKGVFSAKTPKKPFKHGSCLGF